tara:strand:- start:566 stop:817 length:252 start_codon:yes stop_codon:yes gene_type:complete
MIKKIVNKLAVDIINKRGSGDSCIYTDVDKFIFKNMDQWKVIDQKIGYDDFVNMVRKKLNFLYEIEFNILPCFKSKRREHNEK